MRRTIQNHKEINLVTLRNLPPDLVQVLQKETKRKGLSLNKAVIGLLQKNTGLSGKKETSSYHDLDALSGCWTRKEAKRFEKALTAQRTLDLELWK